jgi:hypothetical protein
MTISDNQHPPSPLATVLVTFLVQRCETDPIPFQRVAELPVFDKLQSRGDQKTDLFCKRHTEKLCVGLGKLGQYKRRERRGLEWRGPAMNRWIWCTGSSGRGWRSSTREPRSRIGVCQAAEEA